MAAAAVRAGAWLDRSVTVATVCGVCVSEGERESRGGVWWRQSCQSECQSFTLVEESGADSTDRLRGAELHRHTDRLGV